MFDSNPAYQDFDSEPEHSTVEPPTIEAILQHSELPDVVKTARISHVHERRIDATEISRLTHVSTYQEEDPAIAERLKIRGQALSACLGSLLTCILIRLPGVAYTIEVDAAKGSIAHWEWQRT